MSIGVLQLLLAVLQLLGPLLLPLQLPDVVDRRLQDGAFVPAHVPEKSSERLLTLFGAGQVTPAQKVHRDAFMYRDTGRQAGENSGWLRV